MIVLQEAHLPLWGSLRVGYKASELMEIRVHLSICTRKKAVSWGLAVKRETAGAGEILAWELGRWV